MRGDKLSTGTNGYISKGELKKTMVKLSEFSGSFSSFGS